MTGTRSSQSGPSRQWWLALSSVLIVLLSGVANEAWAVQLAVPRMTIYPGQAISDDMLAAREFQINPSQAKLYVSRELVVGKVAKRTLLPGQPISTISIKDPDVVIQGKAYTVIFQSEGLVITSVGMPLQNGAVGDTIMLRNPDSGQVFRGVIDADGTINVGSP